MTSELKPIDIWDDATNAVCQAMQQSKMCKCPDGECLASTIEPSKETLAHWNTRAAPDVPELVRLTLIDHYGGNSEMVPVGSVKAMYPEEYVLYVQAAEIIVAKDKEIERLNEQNDKFKWQVRDTCTRAEAAEAKLAQYEAQEPFSYLEASLLVDQAFKFWTEKPHNRKWFKRIDGTPIPNDLCSVISERVADLYASPAPAADLKAENERLREEIDEKDGHITRLQNMLRENALLPTVGWKTQPSTTVEKTPMKSTDDLYNLLVTVCAHNIGTAAHYNAVADARATLGEEPMPLIGLPWLGTQPNLELSFGMPNKGDEDDAGVWRVHRRGGNRNDREWEHIAESTDISIAVALARQEITKREKCK